MCAVTRNVSEASGPAQAAAEESAPLSGLGEVIMDQPDANTTAVDTVPSPAFRAALPPGQFFS